VLHSVKKDTRRRGIFAECQALGEAQAPLAAFRRPLPLASPSAFRLALGEDVNGAHRSVPRPTTEFVFFLIFFAECQEAAALGEEPSSPSAMVLALGEGLFTECLPWHSAKKVFFFGIWLPNFLCPTPMATCSPCQSLGNFFFELLYLHDFLCLIAFFPENANLNCACTESSKKLIRKMLFMLLRVRKDRIQELARSFEHLTCEM
jgi:hypothetical protein